MDKIVTLSERAIVEPGFGKTAFEEEFPDGREAWAMVRTLTGRAIFNGADTEVVITHEVTIRYDVQVTSETWVLLDDGTRLDVEDTQDLEERHEYLVLLCKARGTQEASKL
jgi:SPP1 family predicted phage head-tail adaptor